MSDTTLLYQKINELPLNLREEALAFIEKLLKKAKNNKEPKPKKYR